MTKRTVAELLGRLERANLHMGTGEIVPHLPQLSEITFETRSSGNEVTVRMNALGALEDVELRNDIRSRVDPEALAHMLTSTIQQADEVRRTATAEWRQRKGTAHHG